jgi:hypothetical protein
MPNHILWVTSKPKTPEREAEYHNWYNQFHLFQVLNTPGVVAATRYKLSHLQMEWFPPAATFKTWPYGKEHVFVCVYEFDQAADSREVFAALAKSEPDRRSKDPHNDPVDWGEQWFYEAYTEREVSVWLRPGGPSPSKPDGEPNHMFIVPISPISPEVEADFNKYYISQMNVRRPGIAAGIRYKLSRSQGTIDSRIPVAGGDYPFGQHSYLMIYELYDPLLAHHELKPRPRPAGGAGGASWSAPWGQLRRVDEHIVYEPITYRVTPLLVKPSPPSP